ncbi:ABC transporter ATP-binding protein [Candidatus Micrarchaeota archaeon]|nr:ABC transporter ATP-binding protein [Candidatus Micrarchaeota archaeon]
MVELRLQNVSKEYVVESKTTFALQDINLKINKRESVAIVGPSGCGKTTLIRMIAGLEKPTSGQIFLQGKPLLGPDPKIMMVFQNFALLPWKNVVENIELGLLDKPENERAEMIRKYLDVVGMEGFEENYPRDMSSGMKQRVGIARALCREPDILVMDEPFSSLDQLTARNLQSEILRFYHSRKLKPDVLMLVTHNVQEAVFMGDRVIVLSQRPGHVKADMIIELERPRNIRDRKFQDYVDEIVSLIT